MPKEPCPKCGGASWYEVHLQDIVQRCLCGLHRYVYVVRQHGIELHTLPEKQVRLPQSGTKMSKCLAFVTTAYPGSTTTREIALAMDMSTSEASAQMAVLMHKGLIEKTDAKRGQFGGSSWRITRRAKKLLRR